MPSYQFSGLVLAGGKGTRMKSDLPKCAHQVGGTPMASHALRALTCAGSTRNAVVVGHEGDALIAAIDGDFEPVWQREQLGTGHAVLQAETFLKGVSGAVVILPGDAPLISGTSIQRLLDIHRQAGASGTAAIVELNDPTGYGRIVRGPSGEFQTIVEEKDADAATKRIREVGVSVYCFDVQELLAAMPEMTNNNAQREFYLVDILGILVKKGKKVELCKFDDAAEFMGVNDRWQLAMAENELCQRTLRRIALSGVTLKSPQTIFIDADCEVGPGSVLHPGTVLRGKTKVGSGCEIGPGTVIVDSEVSDGCRITLSHLVRCQVGAQTVIGPYANIRPHSKIGERCKIGNFVEVKNAVLSEHVSASHLSYLGDASVGPRTNIGAGTIFCNYDGFSKHRTEIGADAFIGSNSTLVAPVVVGSRAMVAAGSVVTASVPDDGAAFGRARTEIKPEWSAEWRRRMKEKRELQQKEAAGELDGTTREKGKWA